MTSSAITVEADCTGAVTFIVTTHGQGGTVLELWGAYHAGSSARDSVGIGYGPDGFGVGFTTHLAPGSYSEGANVRSDDGAAHDAAAVAFAVPEACPTTTLPPETTTTSMPPPATTVVPTLDTALPPPTTLALGPPLRIEQTTTTSVGVAPRLPETGPTDSTALVATVGSWALGLGLLAVLASRVGRFRS